MKMMARRAYVFSFILMLPILIVLGKSKAGKLIEKSSIDSIAEKVQIEPLKQTGNPGKNMDSMLHLIYHENQKTNLKLDTGLGRQVDYIKSQNFLAIKVIEMSETIHDLKVKNIIPAQVAKDAETGNEKKKVYRLLVLGVTGLWLLVGLVSVIFVRALKITHKEPIYLHDTKRTTE